MLKYPFFVAAVLALAAPAIAQNAAEVDVLTEDTGVFGAEWGAKPAVANAAFTANPAITAVPIRQRPAFDLNVVFSYDWRYKGHKFEVDSYFKQSPSAFTMIGVSTASTAACAALEADLVARLGEGDPEIKQQNDEAGPYESRSRVWMPEGDYISLYAIAIISSPDEDEDFCLLNIVDRRAGLA